MKQFGLLLLALGMTLALTTAKTHPEAKLPFMEYCHFYHYPVETHKIVTEDGYILTYYRIQEKYTTIKEGKPVVFLQHGLLDASDDWILNEEGNAPGFMLANKGYDVWFGNSRGNKHSKEHIKYNANTDKEFWEFSWQHMAKYDLPAAFNYITNYTKQAKIDYIGHSQGTIQMFAALSEKNEVILKKMKHFIALGPVAYVNNAKIDAVELINRFKVFDFMEKFHTYEFMGESFFISSFGSYFCSVFKLVCNEIIGLITNMDKTTDNYERYDVLAGHDPSGTGIQNMKHWMQITKKNSFSKFDYGSEKANMAHYGQSTAPEYDLSNINIDLALFAADSDILADPTDVQHLKESLVNVKNLHFQSIKGGHLTFFWAKNMEFMVDVFNYLEDKKSEMPISNDN